MHVRTAPRERLAWRCQAFPRWPPAAQRQRRRVRPAWYACEMASSKKRREQTKADPLPASWRGDAAETGSASQPVKPARTCLFCGRSGRMSREHLWPKWAQETLDARRRTQPIQNTLHDGDGPPYRTWKQPAFSATLKRVCQQCNNGWMGDLEARVKPYARPMILGRSIALGLDAQKSLALWSYLKCLLFLAVDEEQTLKRAMTKAYPAFYEMQTKGQLPPHCSVFVARHVGLRVGQYQHRLLAWPSGTPAAFVQTLTIGELTVQSVKNYIRRAPLEMTRDARVVGADRRIWPTTGMFAWPPGLALSDENLDVYTGPHLASSKRSRLALPT